ncbi:MAG: hypothetical protein V1913_18475 [Fibrobacterota bacterium]
MRFFLFCCLLIKTASCFPSHEWKHVKTSHFKISYDSQTEHLVHEAAAIAETIYDSLTGYFGYDTTLSAISLVLRDDYDFANGGAYTYMPLVEIECRKEPWYWRGETPWLRNVLAHELSHIFTMRMMNTPLLLTLFGTLNNEPKRDQGYAVTTIESDNLPVWFVEGIAQLGSTRMQSDRRDPYREMLLRDACLSNSMLTLNQMSRFEGTSREYELAYNQGFDFILFLTKNGGDAKIRSLCQNVQSRGLQEAFMEEYRKSIDELFEEWKSAIHVRYDNFRGSEPDGRFLFANRPGVFRMESALSQSGRFLVSNRNNSSSRLDLFSFEEGALFSSIAENVGPFITETSHGRIYFTMMSLNPKTGSENYDIYWTDGTTTKQVTAGARCLTFDASGNSMAAAFYDQGTTRIVYQQENQFVTRTRFCHDTAVYTLRILDSSRLILTVGTGNHQQLLVLEDTLRKALWPQVRSDVMDPAVWNKDTLVFVSTLEGSPQLYWGVLGNDSVWYRITSVKGGVRMPQIVRSPDSTVLRYSLFQEGAFRLFEQRFTPLQNQAVSILPTDTFPTPKPLAVPNTTLLLRPDQSNIVRGVPSLTLGYTHHTYETSDSIITKKGIYTDARFFLMNAPGNCTWQIWASLFKRLTEKYNKRPDVAFTMSLDRDIYKTRNNMSLEIVHTNWENEANTSNGAKYFSVSNANIYTFNLSSAFQTSLRSFLTLYGTKEWKNQTDSLELLTPGRFWYASGTPSLKMDFNDVYTMNRFGIGWEYQKYSSHLYSAILGNAGYRFNGRFFTDLMTYNQDYYDTSVFLIENNINRLLILESRSTDIYLHNTLSLTCEGNVIDIMSVNDSVKVAPQGYLFIGGEDGLSGYPEGYLPVGFMLHASLDFRWAPMVQDNAISAWYRKWALCFKVETAKAVDPLGIGYSGWLASLETACRWSFFIRNNYESTLYFKWAKPLTTVPINNTVDPYRIYFGLAL